MQTDSAFWIHGRAFSLGACGFRVWSALLYVDRSARWPHLVAPLLGCAFCAAGLLWPGSVCEVPPLGVGLFCAAAALEGMS